MSVEARDIKDAGLKLRVSKAGVTQTHLVATSQSRRNVFVSFEQAGGRDFSRTQQFEIQTEDPVAYALVKDNFSVSTDTQIQDGDCVQLAVVLPNGEAIGKMTTITND